ncbi:MAG: InlB B-repeat-containing protein [Treponema sp.]|jgi:uncharacterized repeat protein (TIGR02543 family)|nr:InlB B-repeat-containing protein [Treponema sp.]
MKSNIHKKRPERRFSETAFSTALLAALLLFAGCKDFFHPEGPEGSKDDSTYYTVTFNADGGTPATQTRTVNGRGSVGSSMPSNPTKSGYTFGGWYTSRNGGGSQFTSSTTVTANITVYAKWTAQTQYTVTYNANQGSGTTPSSQTVNAGSSVTLASGSGLTKSGYTFSGWNTNASGTGTSYAANSSYTVTATITLYAKWTAQAQYTVTFNADGGSFTGGSATQTQTALIGGSVGSSMPSNPTKSGYTFGGWYTSTGGGGSQFTSSTTVTGNITVYANWTAASLPSDLSLAESLTWIASNAMEGGDYTIALKNNETIAPKTLSYSGKNVRITLNGGSVERTVSLSSNGSLFTVASGVTLALGNNITLQGRSNNTSSSLVLVTDGGTLVMNTGSTMSGNTSSSSVGGVYVYHGGTFTMSGGTISGNTASVGGGVYVSSGTFTMSGGTISGNTASNTGGGVYVYSGTFTMSGGTISGNIASSAGGGGGGVYVYSGTFTMSGGTISGNTASNAGGGVLVDGAGMFIKQSGGIIYGSDASDSLKNTAASYGHAVYSSGGKERNTTAGTGVILNSGTSGSSGGWE